MIFQPMQLLFESKRQKWLPCLAYTHTISKFSESVILRLSGYLPYANNHGDIFYLLQECIPIYIDLSRMELFIMQCFAWFHAK